ncbi:class I adenylate-forming enzyme family protein [Nocardioides sp. NPDC057767]|uniref:class I adenylate-forming enzyme family protein n=1 Tax=unclassified Nocardioides TaxID=2615069 RepID=UPI0033257039
MTSPWPWALDARTVDGLLAERARTTPTQPGLIDEVGTTLTWSELERAVDGAVGWLSAQGIEPGTRVAWQLPTRISTAVTMLALRRLGAVQAPIIHLYRDKEVTAALRTFVADVLLVPGLWNGFDYAEMAGGLDLAEAPRVIEVGHEIPAEAAGHDHREPSDADSDEVAWVYFTSGSSGAPKGARHTDTSLLTTGRAFGGQGRLGEKSGEVAAMGFPIAHVGGIEYLIAALAGGYPMLLLEAFVPDRAIKAFREYGVTTTGGAPPFYQALVAVARSMAPEPLLPTLRTLKGGGAPCSPELFAAVRETLGIPVAHDYGMTEVPMLGVADPRDPDEILAATDGRPVPGNEVRIMGLDGVPCPPKVPGEIQVSGAGVCRGYTDPEETTKAFTADGWFRTGDLGLLHPTGHIEVTGRLKELIIRKGENIAPLEIESALVTHPAIAEAAVVGLPDEDRGELVCAVVVPAPGTEPPALADLCDFLLDAGLMRQKLPERLEVVTELPRTGLAKVAKAELCRRYATLVSP